MRNSHTNDAIQMSHKRKLIKHEESRYTVAQAKRHLKHHKGVKLLTKQIVSKKKSQNEDKD